MKKKILSLCLVLALAAVAIVGGTLAYFTDTDSEDNTFTTANVKIDLIEKQRNEDGTALEDFKDGKVLMPIVGSAQGDKDKFGMPIAKNYVDKIVTIQNLAVDAWVRLYYAVPQALDNKADDSMDIIHMNLGNRYMADGTWTAENNTNADWTANMGAETFLTETTIDGIAYNVYYMDYNKILTEGEETGSAFMVGLYMDKNVNYDNDTSEYTITRNGETSEINFDFSKGVTIPVYAVGVQAAGFTDADTAVNEAFGANFNPWAAE